MEGGHLTRRLANSDPAPRRVRATLVMLACLGAAPALAVELTGRQQIEILNEAQQAFDRGVALRQANPALAAKAFTEAAGKFQLLVDAGLRNGKLYYNLGNAWLEGSQLGKAIANYRRAERLIPDDPRLQANLRYARSLCRNQIPPSGETAFLRTLFFWHYATSLRGRFLAALTVYILFWLLMTARFWWPRFRWRYLLIPCLIVWLTVGMSVAVTTIQQSRHRYGVVTANDVAVRKGNGLGFELQFKEPLHEGVEFEVLEQRLDWLRIQLADGKTGWIPARDTELI